MGKKLTILNFIQLNKTFYMQIKTDFPDSVISDEYVFVKERPSLKFVNEVVSDLLQAANFFW